MITEHVRVKNTVAGYFHHASGETGPHQHADGSYGQDHPHGCSLGTDGGIEEVDGVIGDADEEVNDGKRAQKRQRSKYECIHSICICPNGQTGADAPRETTSRRDSS